MKHRGFLVLLLCRVLVVSALKSESELGHWEMKYKMEELEARLLSLEKRGSAEMESEKELSRKVQDLEKGADEILEKIAGVEERCKESTAELLGNLQDAENRFLKMDSHLLLETKEVQKKLSMVVEKVNSVEEEVTSALKRDQMEADQMRAQVLETQSMFQTSQKETKDAVFSASEELRTYIDGRLAGLQNILSNLTTRISTLENFLPELSAKLHESSGNLVKTGLQATSETLGNEGSLEVITNTYSDLPGTDSLSEKNQDFFDATFVLESTPLVTKNFNCYSNENRDKITFSRALDTGRGRSLSKNSTVHVEHNRYRFSFTDYDYLQRFGAFQCELNVGQHGYMKIVTLIQRIKYLSDMVSLDPFRVTSIGDSVKFKVDIFRKMNLTVKWRHNGVDVPSWDDQLQVEIQNVQPKDAGIYECFYEGRRNESSHALMRLIVRNCKENLYGTGCAQECPPCYNGGVCHDLLGICVCPAGFSGDNCEVPCHGMSFGVNCAQKCDSRMCTFRYFCKPDPYGCSCASGYTGFDCREKCKPGFYGANCKQVCHCANGPTSCNGYSGVCTGGCSPGWGGRSCQIEDFS